MQREEPLMTNRQRSSQRRCSLLSMAAGLLLLMALIAYQGGRTVQIVTLGLFGLLVSFLGIIWAAAHDGPAALTREPTPGRRASIASPGRSLGIGLALLCVFLGLALSIRLPGVQSLDVLMLHRTYQSGSPQFTGVMQHITDAGGGDLVRIWIPVILVLLWLGGRHRSLRFFAATLFGTLGLEAICKTCVARPRPEFISGMHLNSFPSGHALSATILAGTLLLIYLPSCRRSWQRVLLWSAALAWPFLIASSRVYLGCHYPTDVVGSVFLGASSVCLCRSTRVWLAPCGTPGVPSPGSRR